MAKKQTTSKKSEIKKHEDEVEFFFHDDDFDDEADSAAVSEIFSMIIAANAKHMDIALELTKLSVGQSSGKLDQKQINTIFTESLKNVQENSPITKVMTEFGY